MRRNDITAWAALALFTTTSLVVSCSDWDSHYGVEEQRATAVGTLWENIKADGRLTRFAALVEQSGMGPLLDGANTYTVWAPEDGTYNADSVALLGSRQLQQQFVKNHIGHANRVLSGAVDQERMVMLNGKAMRVGGDGSYAINSVPVGSSTPGSNGPLYVLGGMLPFNNNLYEFLTNSTKYDISTIDSFYQANHRRSLNISKSLAGPIVNGQITYLDSIFDETNDLFTRYGSGYINTEDSSYSMVVPTNTAWTKAQRIIAPYFKYLKTYGQSAAVLTDDYVAELTINDTYLSDSLVRRSIMRNLIYNNNLYGNRALQEASPALGFQGDSLVSIAGTVLRGDDAATLIGQARKETLSNGVMWITDSLRIRPWNGWCTPIVIEAENASTLLNTRSGVSETNSTQVLTVGIAAQNPAIAGAVSGHRYLQVNPGSPSDNPMVYFRVPNALSTTYSVFIRLVPENILDAQIENPAKDSVQLRIFYHRLSDSRMVYQTMSGSNGVSVGSDLNAVVTRYVGDIAFPAAYQGLGNMAPVIRVQGRGANQAGYTNTLRIDAIYLVPRELLDYIHQHPDYKDAALRHNGGILPISVDDVFNR